MQKDPTYQRFVDFRSRIYERLDAIRASVDGWLDRQAQQLPEMSDLALLEGLQEERRTLLSEYQQAEDDFMAYVLSHRPPRPGSQAG